MKLVSTILSVLIFTSVTLISQYPDLKDTVKIVRDEYGVPHITADNEEALFFGAGYAAAEDRLFQMVLLRRVVQGRLAEIFGRQYLDNDIKMRTMGLYKHAQLTLKHLHPDILKQLIAYAAGINAYMRDNPRHMSELFAEFGGSPEPWEPYDAIACQMRIAERFDGGWTKEVGALRNFQQLEASVGRDSAVKLMELGQKNIDDSSAIVSMKEYYAYPDKLKNLNTSEPNRKKTKNDMKLEEWQQPKMSHHWVVSGSRTKSGYPILESDPQIRVEAPATWYEFHIKGGRYNVRGISVPGSPGMLIGFNENVSWGLTALGGDCADLFMEELNQDETEYKYRNEWKPLTIEQESIKVKGERDYALTIKSTIHGPIVNDHLNGVRDGEYFSLHYMNVVEPATTVEALLDMMASKDWHDFTAGMSKYISPGVNLIYADKFDNIAYYTLIRTPDRVHNAGFPFDGVSGNEEWKGIVPFDSMPRMLNPDIGFISTANNCPIGSWYKYFVGGAIGDNGRSARLKELLFDASDLEIADFYRIHQDSENPIIRDFVKYGIMAVDEDRNAGNDAKALADTLRDWDFKLLTSYPKYYIVAQIGVIIKRSIRGTPLEDRYLGSDAGLLQLFRDVNDYYEEHNKLIPDKDIRDWLLSQMGEVYTRTDAGGRGGNNVVKHEMKYQNNLENFGSLKRDYDFISPPLYCGVVETIWSQQGNSYSQIVNHANIDSSLSILPPGNSEVPDDKHFDDMIDLWVDGKMHIAPLNMKEVEKIKESEKTLYPEPMSAEEFNDKVIITPNPARDYIEINDVILNEVKDPVLYVKVFDVLGVEVLTHPLTPSREGELRRIDISSLSPGVYFVSVGGRMFKFVKI